MDIKKSSKATLEDKKFTNILMGLVVVLAVLYIGFEWTNKEVVVYDDFASEAVIEEEEIIIQTAQELPPPPPPPAPEIVEEINVVEDDVKVEEVVVETEDNKEREIVINPPTTFGTGPYEETDDNVVFQIVERMPAFPGGDAALMKYLSDNIKYPVIAQENGIQGNVTLQFVVNRDGGIVDIEIVRSVDKNLDNEAIRVVKGMPKWSPGQQRGKPVRVRYTLPVRFRLQ